MQPRLDKNNCVKKKKVRLLLFLYFLPNLIDGLITDLTISSGTYSFYKYNSSGNKVYTSGVVDSGIYLHHIRIEKTNAGYISTTIINRSSDQLIAIETLASYLRNGATIMCSGYMIPAGTLNVYTVSGLKYAGVSSIYAICFYSGASRNLVIDRSYTIYDTVKSL